jgi:hypothetical protein
MNNAGIQPYVASAYWAIKNGNGSTIQSLTSELGLKPDIAEQATKTLVQKGVVTQQGERFIPNPSADDAFVNQLETFFRSPATV